LLAEAVIAATYNAVHSYWLNYLGFLLSADHPSAQNLLSTEYTFSSLIFLISPVATFLIPFIVYRRIDLRKSYKPLIAYIFLSAWLGGWVALIAYNQIVAPSFGVASDDPITSGVKAFGTAIGTAFLALLGIVSRHFLKRPQDMRNLVKSSLNAK